MAQRGKDTIRQSEVDYSLVIAGLAKYSHTHTHEAWMEQIDFYLEQERVKCCGMIWCNTLCHRLQSNRVIKWNCLLRYINVSSAWRQLWSQSAVLFMVMFRVCCFRGNQWQCIVLPYIERFFLRVRQYVKATSCSILCDFAKTGGVAEIEMLFTLLQVTETEWLKYGMIRIKLSFEGMLVT